MFRKKVVIILYEVTGTKGGIGKTYIGSRLFSYGTLFDKAYEMLTNKYGSDNLVITNVIKL